jgi:hypothetical protein
VSFQGIWDDDAKVTPNVLAFKLFDSVLIVSGTGTCDNQIEVTGCVELKLDRLCFGSLCPFNDRSLCNA